MALPLTIISSLSKQLNEKSTHCLLELLQNADDNIYTRSTPALNFIYKPGILRVDCNEDGFTAANIEAICDVHKSTKAGQNRSAGYIGEKGIGFKSIFKIADVVWISSRQYTFKFDKREQIGMITPMWAEFPEPTLQDYTSFFLQLSKDCDQEELIQELLNFDPALMIFLRRVKVINLQVARPDGTDWVRKLHRTESVENDDEVVVLHSGEISLRYITRTHRVEGLPHNAQRPDCVFSELHLAFPVTDFNKKPHLGSQNVYAFLPIRNYGFKVKISALLSHCKSHLV